MYILHSAHAYDSIYIYIYSGRGGEEKEEEKVGYILRHYARRVCFEIVYLCPKFLYKSPTPRHVGPYT